jgi:hypothetical protein
MLILLSSTRFAPIGADLVRLKRALDNNDLHALNAYLAVLPLCTKNALFKAAGERFGFQTHEVEDIRYLLVGDLAQCLDRSSDTTSLKQ